MTTKLKANPEPEQPQTRNAIVGGQLRLDTQRWLFVSRGGLVAFVGTAAEAWLELLALRVVGQRNENSFIAGYSVDQDPAVRADGARKDAA